MIELYQNKIELKQKKPKQNKLNKNKKEGIKQLSKTWDLKNDCY